MKWMLQHCNVYDMIVGIIIVRHNEVSGCCKESIAESTQMCMVVILQSLLYFVGIFPQFTLQLTEHLKKFRPKIMDKICSLVAQ